MSTPNAEAEIRLLLEKWQEAVTTGNTAALLEIYAPDALVYDMKMPHMHRGPAAYKAIWDACLPMFELPARHEVKDMEIIVGGDVAFAHCLARFGGQIKNGPEVGSWIRVTLGYRKVDGAWKVAHEHVSVPLNMENMTPAMDFIS